MIATLRALTTRCTTKLLVILVVSAELACEERPEDGLEDVEDAAGLRVHPSDLNCVDAGSGPLHIDADSVGPFSHSCPPAFPKIIDCSANIAPDAVRDEVYFAMLYPLTISTPHSCNVVPYPIGAEFPDFDLYISERCCEA